LAATETFLGNFPQALRQLGLNTSALTIDSDADHHS